MNKRISINQEEERILLRALDLLINQEEDTVNYSRLINKIIGVKK